MNSFMKTSRRLGSVIIILLIICSSMRRCESPEEAENSKVMMPCKIICSCFSIYSSIVIIICSPVRSRQIVLLAAADLNHMYSTGRTEGLQLHTRSTSVHTNTCSAQTSTRRPLYPPTELRMYVVGTSHKVDI